MPFCQSCGKEIPIGAVYCPSCSAKQTTAGPSTMILEQKNPWLAAVLALILGLFGLWGIGHIYVGKLGKGLILLFVGIIISAIVIVSFLVGFVTLGVGFIFALIFSLVDIIGWIWQTYDAYSLAKEFNTYVTQYGKAPW